MNLYPTIRFKRYVVSSGDEIQLDRKEEIVARAQDNEKHVMYVWTERPVSGEGR